MLPADHFPPCITARSQDEAQRPTLSVPMYASEGSRESAGTWSGSKQSASDNVETDTEGMQVSGLTHLAPREVGASPKACVTIRYCTDVPCIDTAGDKSVKSLSILSWLLEYTAEHLKQLCYRVVEFSCRVRGEGGGACRQSLMK